MAASNIITLRPRTDAVDWDALAHLMRIPDDYGRETFTWWLQTSIKQAWWDEEKLPARRQNDVDIARTGRAFIRAIAANRPDDPFLKDVRGYLGTHVKAPRRGAPKRAHSFDLFLQNIIGVTCTLGGHVSFNRVKASGNILDLLAKVRPMLPPDFIPDPDRLPNIIERLATKARGRRRDMDERLRNMGDSQILEIPDDIPEII